MNTDCIITIDGPSGVGKGTVAQYLCEETGFHLLDSGAIYRSLAFGVQKQGLMIENLPGLVALAENLPVRFETGKVFYQDEDISSQIRTEAVAATASKIASIAEVRAALLKRQMDFAQPPGLIADGRDMGTVVFPKAPVKLFLTATAEERAKRRLNQLKNQEVDVNIRKITQDIKERDERDRNRATSPLLPAADALTIDTTHLSISQVCELALNAIRQKGLIE
jgi:cytidylate kinase